jgi:hypothetical protein
MQPKPQPKQSAAYKKGYANAAKSFYWTWCYNRDIDLYKTMQAKVDFYNGYHDGLADHYKLARPAHTIAANVKDKFELYIYD